MNILDPRIIEGKDFNTVMNFAENLKLQSLEGIINAHKIYTLVLDTIEKSLSNEQSYIRGMIRHKIWELEKQIGWNPKYFSQAGQDKLVHKNFFNNNNNEGFFLDIGAYNGIDGSNSYFFERYLNWKGILVEPSKKQFEKLINNRTNKSINTAISSEVESLEFVEVVEGLTQMSGLKQEYYDDTLKLVEADPNSSIEKYQIRTSVFSDLVRDQIIDYLSIDIEGGELSLLNSIDFDFYKIKVISIENNKPNKVVYHNFLGKYGYVFFDFCGADEIYFNPSYL